MVKTKEFTDDEWEAIFEELKANPNVYGLPQRVPGSALLGSFNIRKLGKVENRSANTWKFLGIVCKSFDLIAIQEVMDDMDGIHRLMEEMEGEYKLIASDKTGTYPGDAGLGERLAFLYRTSTVELGEVISDVTYDRSKVTEIMFDHLDEINAIKQDFDNDMKDYESGKRKGKPKLEPPTFLAFIRSPYCVSFKMKGEEPGYEPYSFMAVNAHLIYGKPKDRWREFEAIMNWIRDRVVQQDKMYYPNFILLGDLNLDYDDPKKDHDKMEKFMKSIDEGTSKEIHVNFPFLDIHPNETAQFTSNVLLTQRYDQIGMFFRDDDGQDKGYPTHKENAIMGKDEQGPDYGVFNFSDLFANVLKDGKRMNDLGKDPKKALVKRFQHEVSDHMPIWLRLKLRKSDDTRRNKKRRV
jgi:endonuclease/exonuclease/phosphatase family metal-dependent hydrolase